MSIQKSKKIIKNNFRLIISFIVCITLIIVGNKVLFADESSDYDNYMASITNSGQLDKSSITPVQEGENNDLYIDDNYEVTSDEERTEQNEYERDKEKKKTSGLWNEYTEATETAYHNLNDWVKLNTADPIYTRNHTGTLDTGTVESSTTMTAVFCMNSSRISNLQINGKDVDGVQIKEKVVKSTRVNKSKKEDGDGWELDRHYKDIDDAKVDGFTGYAVWQWKKGEISALEMQELIWQSGLIDDAEHFDFSNAQESKGAATVSGNNAIDGAVLDALLSGAYGMSGEAVDGIKRPAQYQQVYKDVLSNLKVYFKGNLTYNDGNDDVTDKDVARFYQLAQYASKTAELIAAADFNGDGVVDKKDENILLHYKDNAEEYRQAIEEARQKYLNGQDTLLVNEDAPKYALLTADVDYSRAQTMIDQREKSYVMGPYNAEVKIDKATLADQSKDIESKKDFYYYGSLDNSKRSVSNESSLGLFINELRGKNVGERAKSATAAGVPIYEKDQANQFAWFDEKSGVEIRVLNQDGEEVTSQNSGMTFVICNENGDEVTDENEIRDIFLMNKNFFVKIKFKDYNMLQDYITYERDYEQLSKPFTIDINMAIRYIDQFYVSREVYEYVKDANGDTIKVPYGPSDPYHNVYKYYYVDNQFKKENNKNYKTNVEEPIEQNGTLESYYTYSDGTEYEQEYKIKYVCKDPSSYTMKSAGSAEADKATWYTLRQNYGYWLKIVTKQGYKAGYKWKIETDDDEYSGTIGREEDPDANYNGTIITPIIQTEYSVPGTESVEYEKYAEWVPEDFSCWDDSDPGYPLGNKYYEIHTYYEYIPDDHVIVCQNRYVYTDIIASGNAEFFNGDYVNGIIDAGMVKEPLQINSPILPDGYNYREWKSEPEYDSLWPDYIKYSSIEAVSDGCPKSELPNTHGLYIKAWSIEKTLMIESVVTTTGTPTVSVNGKSENTTYTQGTTVPVDNVEWTGSENTGVTMGSGMPTNTGYSDHYDGGVNVYKVKDYEWQDFEKMIDVDYTTSGVDLNIHVDITTRRKESLDFKVKNEGVSIDIGGKVWIDKDSQIKAGYGDMEASNGKYDGNEKLYEGIIVTLTECYFNYEDSNLIPLNTYQTVTGSDGKYAFYGLDPRSKYYVSFEYNGMLYQPTYYKSNTPYGGNYSNAYELQLAYDKDGNPKYNSSRNDDSGINSRFETIRADVNGNEDFETSSNYYTNSGTTNRAYGLNQKIMDKNGDYISIGNDKKEIKVNYQGTEYTFAVDHTDYYNYGLVVPDGNNGLTGTLDGNDNILTFGDVYDIYRQVLVSMTSGLCQKDNDNMEEAIYIKRAIDNDPKYSKYNDIKELFKQALWSINSNIDNDELENLYKYILDTKMYAFTFMNTSKNKHQGKSLGEVYYPTRDYFICEDVKDAYSGNDKLGKANAYEMNYKTEKDQINTRKTLLGAFLNKQKISAKGAGYKMEGLDYVYTEGHKYSDDNITEENCQKYYKKNDNTVGGGVDFGLTYRAETDIEVDKDVAKVTLTVNGQKLEYEYGQKDFMKNTSTFNVEDPTNGKELFDGTLVYNRQIRTADYLFNSVVDQEGYGNPDKDLNVYVTYAIMVRNQSKHVTTKINELVDYYDNEAFDFTAFDKNDSKNPILYDNTYIIKYNNVLEEIEKGKKEALKPSGRVRGIQAQDSSDPRVLDADAKLYVTDTPYYGNHNGILKRDGAYDYSNCSYIHTEGDELTLNPGEYAICYITYKVKEENGKPLMDQVSQDAESCTYKTGKRNLAEINSYSTTYADNVVIPHSLAADDSKRDVSVGGQKAGIVDKDSNPGSLRNKDLYQDDGKSGEDNKQKGRIITNFYNNQENRKEDDIAEAPNVRLIFDNSNESIRTISGTVFDDERTNPVDGALIGDGQFNDTKEKGINGVTVQLVELVTNINDYGEAIGTVTERVVGYQKYQDNGVQDGETDESRYTSGTENVERVIKTFGTNNKFKINPREDLGQGQYSFTNVPAGYYFVRFIYGESEDTVLTNGTVEEKLGDTAEGTEVKTQRAEVNAKVGKQGLNEKSYNGQDYKSTIYYVGDSEIKFKDTNKTISKYTNYENQNLDNGEKSIQAYWYTENKVDKTSINDPVDEQYKLVSGEDYADVSKLYTFDINGNATAGRNSDAKDVYSYRVRANNWANGVDTTNDLRNYRAEVLSSFEKVLQNEKAQEQAQKDAIDKLKYHTQMVAQTGVMDLTFEIKTDDNEENTNVNVNHASYSITGYDTHSISDYEINNVDFGLTERPRAQLSLNKEVSNFAFITATGQRIVDSKETQNGILKFKEHDEHITDGKNKNNGEVKGRKTSNANKLSGFRIVDKIPSDPKLEIVSMALDDELIAGSQIEVTYDIKVTNVGDIDYTSKQFYYSGAKAADDNISKTTAVSVVDYPTNALRYDETDQTKEDDKAIWNNVKTVLTEKVNGTTGKVEKTTDPGTAITDTDPDLQDTLVIMVIPDADTNNDNMQNVADNIATNQNYSNFNPTDPSWGRDFVNRNVVEQLTTYDKVLKTESLDRALVPIGNESDSLFSSNTKKLILRANTDIVSDDFDLVYNNLAEIVATRNDQGRRMQLSIAGNQELVNNNAGKDAGQSVNTMADRITITEIDADSAQKVQITAPTGEDKSYVLIAATIIGAIALIAGAVVVLKKLNK